MVQRRLNIATTLLRGEVVERPFMGMTLVMQTHIATALRGVLLQVTLPWPKLGENDVPPPPGVVRELRFDRFDTSAAGQILAYFTTADGVPYVLKDRQVASIKVLALS